MPRSDFRLLHPLRVRWAEVDPQGVVFNAHYLAYADVGVTEYWRAVGCPYPEAFLPRGADVYVVKATLEFHAPAEYDDELEIGMRCARLGRSSIVMRSELLRGEQRLNSAELIYVNVDPATRSSSPVPEFLREAIIAFEVLTPD
jgi:acyl-CoA thioester hydrolase